MGETMQEIDITTMPIKDIVGLYRLGMPATSYIEVKERVVMRYI
jgi:hypothetical protein